MFIFVAVMLYAALMTQNKLTAAAREGGRMASLPSVTSQDTAIDAVKERLQRAGLDPDSATVTVNPSDLGNVVKGDEISVTVSVPLSESTWLQYGGFLSGAVLAAEITYIRE